MNVGTYIGLRLLEVECNFPSYFDNCLEVYFTRLDEEYASFARCKTKIREITGGDLTMLKTFYVSLLCEVTKTPPEFNIDVIFKVFMLSRDYIQYLKLQRNGMFAMTICIWLGEFINNCGEVNWNEDRKSFFYQTKRFMIILNVVIDDTINNVLYSIKKFAVDSNRLLPLLLGRILRAQ